MYTKKINRKGVYQIKNLVNNKIYIGSSVDYLERWNQHKKLLRSGKHYNKHLQYAWTKYGEDNFEFSVLDICDDYLIKEEILIKKNNTIDPDIGYNIYEKVVGGRRKKPIIQYDLSGNYIKYWDTVKTAALENGICSTGIVACCKNKIRHSGKYMWRYFDGTIPEKIEPYEEYINKKPYLDNRCIFGYDVKTKSNIGVWNSFKNVRDIFNVDESTIRRVVKYDISTWKGLIFVVAETLDEADNEAMHRISHIKKYDSLVNLKIGIKISAEKRQRPVDKLDIDGNFICTYKSIKDAAAAIDRIPSTVLTAIKNKKRTAGGYKWKYKEL